MSWHERLRRGFTPVVESSGGSSTLSFTWTVTDANQLPTIANPGNQSNRTGDIVSVQLTGSDPNGDQLQHSAIGLPPGLTIDGVSGEIYGTLDATAAFNGPYSVTVTAANQTLSSSQTFTWAVSDPNLAPVLPTLADQSNAPGDGVLVSIQASDANSDTVSYTATGLPLGVTLDPVNGQLTGTIDPSAVTGSPYTVTVTASDGAASSSATFHWTIHPVSVAPPGGLRLPSKKSYYTGALG